MPANPHDALPIRLNVDDSDSPSDVVDALFLGRFASGEQPYSHSVTIERVKAEATLLPPEATVLRSARDSDRSATLAEGEGWTMLVSRWSRGADVTVTAVSDELASSVLGEATEGAGRARTAAGERHDGLLVRLPAPRPVPGRPARSRPGPGRRCGPTTRRRWPGRWTG